MPTVVPAMLTVEEFEAMARMEGYELVDENSWDQNGGCETGWIGGQLVWLLTHFTKLDCLGLVFSSESGYACFPHRPKLVRKPDVSFVASGRFEGDRPPRGYARLAPDLVAEVVSPRDTYEEVEDRVNDYLRAGVRMIWVLTPATRTILCYTGGHAATRLTGSDELIGDPVLPGFRVRVADLFPPPLTTLPIEA
ncbi:MAG: Uma2 family endonuclease [Bacteroidales bacterium]|nr:Uma2 family endonuclease [Bacteroidales bacterium]